MLFREGVACLKTEIIDSTCLFFLSGFPEMWAWWQLNMSSQKETMQVRETTFIIPDYWLCCRRSSYSVCFLGPVSQVLPIWGLAIPLPAVLMITLSLYMVVLGIGLWIRSCLKVGAAARPFSFLHFIKCTINSVNWNLYQTWKRGCRGK